MWIAANLGTILISLFLLLIVAGIIRSLIQNKKKGNHPVAETVHIARCAQPVKIKHLL